MQKCSCIEIQQCKIHIEARLPDEAASPSCTFSVDVELVVIMLTFVVLLESSYESVRVVLWFNR